MTTGITDAGYNLQHYLLRYGHWSSDGSVFEKPYGHLPRQTDATVRRGKWWDITLVHGITTSEKHRVRHPRAIEMRPFRTKILS